MLPQSEFESPMFANGPAPVAIAAITQDRALIGLLRSTIDPSNDLILVTSEAELTPHLNSRRVSAALLDSMFIEGDLAGMAERLRATWPDLVLVVVGTAEEQSKVAAQITSGVVYRFLHRPVSAPRVRLFVDAALRRHEVENVERTLEQVRPDFSRLEAQNKAQAKASKAEASRRAGTPGVGRALLPGILGAAAVVAAGVAWFVFFPGDRQPPERTAGNTTPVVSPMPPADAPARAVPTPAAVQPPEQTVADTAPAPVVQPPAHDLTAAAPDPASTELPSASTAQESSRLRPAGAVIQVPDEVAPQTPAPAPALSHEQRLREMLAQAEAALQRGELASPVGRNAVALFTGALQLDSGNTLAKAGLVRVADRLLSAAERALTAGNVEDARNMVGVAESITPATARGAFLMMQIEMERERASLARDRENVAQGKQDKGATYVRLANARLQSGALIEPPGDNARFYLDAARQITPDDEGVAEATRALQKQLLDRAASAAAAGNAADTERWLANADGAGAARPDMTAIRRSLQDTLIGARAERMASLTRSFNAALSANRLLQPANDNAKAHLLALIDTDGTSAAVISARQSLGTAYLNEARGSLSRNDPRGAETWLGEALSIGFHGEEAGALEKQIADARARAESANAAQAPSVVGANSLQRLEYVSPQYPVLSRMSRGDGWVEVEFTVRTDGSTGDIKVTNSSPRRVFDNAATSAVAQWRYKPVIRDGKPIEQRAAVRIRFAEN